MMVTDICTEAQAQALKNCSNKLIHFLWFARSFAEQEDPGLIPAIPSIISFFKHKEAGLSGSRPDKLHCLAFPCRYSIITDS